jgi:hypothetical protein
MPPKSTKKRLRRKKTLKSTNKTVEDTINRIKRSKAKKQNGSLRGEQPSTMPTFMGFEVNKYSITNINVLGLTAFCAPRITHTIKNKSKIYKNSR